MRLLVTGGTGLLGGAVIDRALAAGYRVTATHWSQPPRPGRARWSRVDVADGRALTELARLAAPDAVIHTAYRYADPGMRAATVDGARNAAEAARAVGAGVVHLSTDVVFDGEREGAYAEDDPPSPVTDYARAKVEAEALVRAAHPGALVVRTSLLYTLAPDDRQCRLALDLLEGRARGALFTDETRCPLLADELADALVELAGRGVTGLLHVAGGDAVSRHEFGAMLLRARGVDPSGLPAARSADQPVRRPRNCALDGSRARALLRSRVRGAREVLAAR